MAGPRLIGSTLSAIAGQALAPSLGATGQAYAMLVAQWSSIVGPRLAGQALPVKLQFPTPRMPAGAKPDPRQPRQDGVLHLQVTSAAALFVQHEEPQILQRLNAYFGYRVVARLKLVHGVDGSAPGKRRKATAAPRPRRLSPAEVDGLSGQLDQVDDPALREALDRLGRAILESS